MQLGLGGSASIEELLAAREAAERRLRISQKGVRPPVTVAGSRMPALGSGESSHCSSQTTASWKMQTAAPLDSVH